MQIEVAPSQSILISHCAHIVSLVSFPYNFYASLTCRAGALDYNEFPYCLLRSANESKSCFSSQKSLILLISRVSSLAHFNFRPEEANLSKKQQFCSHQLMMMMNSSDSGGKKYVDLNEPMRVCFITS